MRADKKTITGICVCVFSCLIMTGCSSISQSDLDTVREQGYDEGYTAGELQGYERGFNDGEQQASEEAAGAFAEVIETPYYTIEIPVSWEGTYEYTYQDGLSTSPNVAGMAGYRVIITNKVDDKMMFTVCCAKDEYPGVGNGWFEDDIGRTTIDPQYRILVGRTIYMNDGSEGYGTGSAFGPDRTNEYINYINIK